jgi:hypothetical protein
MAHATLGGAVVLIANSWRMTLRAAVLGVIAVVVIRTSHGLSIVHWLVGLIR